MKKLKEDLETFRDRVESLLKNDSVYLDGSTVPSIDIIHDDLGGSLSVVSFMERDVSEMLREEVGSTIESDVFMLTCSAFFRMESKSMKLNCSIVNEDGIPVRVLDSKRASELNQFVSKTRNEIFNIFKSI